MIPWKRRKTRLQPHWSLNAILSARLRKLFIRLFDLIAREIWEKWPNWSDFFFLFVSVFAYVCRTFLFSFPNFFKSSFPLYLPPFYLSLKLDYVKVSEKTRKKRLFLIFFFYFSIYKRRTFSILLLQKKNKLPDCWTENLIVVDSLNPFIWVESIWF